MYNIEFSVFALPAAPLKHSKDMTETVYYIMATNRLSGKREAISAGYFDYGIVEGIYKNYLRVRPDKRTHLRPTIHHSTMSIPFKQKK